MLIICKYVNTIQDLINVMKINKKYGELCNGYHFNPVNIYTEYQLELFPKLFTYHIYNKFDYFPNNNKFNYVYEYEINIDEHTTTFNEKYLKTSEYIDSTNIKSKYSSNILKRRIYDYNKCSVEKIELGENVKYIEPGAFNFVSTKTLILPNYLEQLGGFQCNETLKEIIIPDLITDIPSYCFDKCYELEKVIMGKNVKRLGKFAFGSCKKLKNIDLSNVDELDSCDFINCKSLTSVVLSKNIKVIPDCCFGGCSNLANINLENIEVINESGLRHTDIKYAYLFEIREIHALGLAMNNFLEVYLGNNLNICESSIRTKVLICPKRFENIIEYVDYTETY
jgi:hypothetical protein